MIRGFVRGLASRPFSLRSLRCFSDAPAVGGQAAQGDSGIQKYVNGELVRKNLLTLKKSEDIEGFVVAIVRDYFRTTNKANISLESSLADHGLDSLDSIEISMRIEEELGYVISAESLPVLNKVKHYVNYIKQVEAFKEKHGQAPLA